MARKFQLESNFGKFFDPIADKILVVSVIFIMVVGTLIIVMIKSQLLIALTLPLGQANSLWSVGSIRQGKLVGTI